jgi:hypothetical protein
LIRLITAKPGTPPLESISDDVMSWSWQGHGRLVTFAWTSPSGFVSYSAKLVKGNAGSLALGGMFSSTWHGASVSDGRVDLADSTCPDVGVTLVANTLSVTNFRK